MGFNKFLHLMPKLKKNKHLFNLCSGIIVKLLVECPPNVYFMNKLEKGISGFQVRF